MTNRPTKAGQALRRRAEEKLTAGETAPQETLSPEAAKQLIHELRVHQIELEMQNEELRSTQKRLEEARSRYFDLYDLAPVGYLTLNGQGLVQEANLAVATMLGEKRKNLLRKPISKFIFREDQDIYYLHRKKILDSNELQSWEMRMKRADGMTFWAHLHAIPMQNSEYWITVTDITEQRQAAAKLQTAANYARSLLEASLDPLVTISAEGKITDVNRAAEHATGLSREQLVGSDFCDYFTETEKARAGYRKAFTEGLITDYPLAMRHTSGKIVEVLYNATVYRDATGSVAGVFAAARDITERKQAEKVLQARVTISKYAFEHSLDELLTKVLDEAEALTGSRIGFFHFVAADQMTLTLQAWSTNTLSNFCTAEGKGRHQSLESSGVWADCIREKRALIQNDFESLANRKGLPPGHAAVQREIVLPIFRNNLVVAVLGVGNKPSDYTFQELSTLQHLANLAWDIVTRKKAEEALMLKQQQLETLNRSLESRIVTSVAEMRRKDDMLIQQGRLAAMGEMINNIAHQWRQPLNNLGLIVQNLKLSHDAGELTVEAMDKDVSKAMGVILYMSSTIDDFRNFFAYEKEPSLFNVNKVVSRALDFVMPALKNSGIRVELDEQPGISVTGYPNEYLQALLNVLNNAKDILLEHKVADPFIGIRIFRENNRSLVTIRDNGGGIREDILPKIFDPYFSTKGQGKGTGIGLYMSKAIIEKNMDGRLSVRNLDGGAEFRIEV